VAHEHAVERARIETGRQDPPGRETLEVVEVRTGEEPATLVVKQGS
jgi:hypothetical protein